MLPKIVMLTLLAIPFVDNSVCVAGDFDELRSQNWHQWRGPDARGISATANPPLEWSETDNIQWKVPIEGMGNGTPIIWKDRVFVTTVIDTHRVDAALTPPNEQPDRPFGIKYPNTFHQYVVLCLDRKTGKELWRKIAAEEVPQEGHHGDNSFASASPTTDGQRLYVCFGSAGIYCYGLDGMLIWDRRLGPVETRLSFGEASSPVVHDGRLIIIRDHDRQSYIVVLDAETGEPVWQKDRDEPSAWATPFIVEHDGRTQVITNGKNRVRSYDLEDGSLIWECGGQVSNVTPSPVATDDTVYCMSGYKGSALYAIPLDASGDITDSAKILWSKSQDAPYVPSPLLYDGRLYFNKSNSPILTSLDAQTGDVLIDRTRLPGISALYASPVGTAGRVYYVGRGGTTLVLEHADAFNVLATNSLDADIDASPAIAGNQFFLRSKTHLYCIAEDR